MLTYRSWLLAIVVCSLSSSVALGQNRGDDLEFVGDGEIQAVDAETANESASELDESPALDPDFNGDKEPPRIEDIAVASANAEMAPMVTAIITDDFSGVDRALFFYRVTGDNKFQKAVLVPGAGGLFITRLPDGVQNKGFDYYVEVYDAANESPSRIGSADVPLFVPAAVAGTTLTSTYMEETETEIHPGWVMLSIGSGIGLTAISGWFFYDLGTVVLPQIENPKGASLAGLQNSRTGDILMGSVMATLGVGALGTGFVLMALNADVE